MTMTMTKFSFVLFQVVALWTCSGAAFLSTNKRVGTSPFLRNDLTLKPSLIKKAGVGVGVGIGPIQQYMYKYKGDHKQETPAAEEKPARRPRSAPSFRKPVHTNVCPQTGVTLSRYMMEMERLNPELEEVESIFTSIQVGCKAISKLVRTSTLASNTGAVGSINVQGEEQKKMDILANDVLKNALRWAGHFKTIASEEEEEPLVGFMHENGRAEALVDASASYIAVFDPLDGSSNIDAGIPVGTIFGIFQHREGCGIEEADDMCLEDILQPGRNLIAAGYCLYSSATTLVFTLGDGTHGFTLDESLGEFVLTHPNIQIPHRGAIYSFNEGNRWDWDQPVQDYITNIQQGKGETGSRYSGRYVGSMVADIHRTLQYGGIFGYPADKRNLNGKLRLLYEAAPMAFLVEQAGGAATTGVRPIMDVLPTDVHARVPCILGSPGDVAELQSYYTSNSKKAPNDSDDEDSHVRDRHMPYA